MRWEIGQRRLLHTLLTILQNKYTREYKLKNVSEKTIESYLNKRVKENHGLSYKWISTITGVPDRIVILNQQAMFVELKTQTGELSARQVIVFGQLGEAGFPVHVLRSKEDVDDFIKTN